MRTLLLLLLTGLLFSSLCYAMPKQTYQQPAQHTPMIEEAAKFSPAERHMIRSYLGERDRHQKSKPVGNLPYGLQKKVARGKQLPPGWQNKVIPGRSLDYQIYRYGLPLPEELLKKLPPGPTGAGIIQVDASIIRLNTTTRTVLDIFDLVQETY